MHIDRLSCCLFQNVPQFIPIPVLRNIITYYFNMKKNRRKYVTVFIYWLLVLRAFSIFNPIHCSDQWLSPSRSAPLHGFPFTFRWGNWQRLMASSFLKRPELWADYGNPLTTKNPPCLKLQKLFKRLFSRPHSPLESVGINGHTFRRMVLDWTSGELAGPCPWS